MPGSAARFFSLAAVGAALLVAGCGEDSTETRASTQAQSFDKQELGSPIEVEAGSSFEFVLDSNVTTGYRWALTSAPRPAVVTYEGSSYESEPGTDQAVGAGGQETLRFEAVGPGSVEIKLEYAFLGGAKGDKPAERIQAQVTVR